MQCPLTSLPGCNYCELRGGKPACSSCVTGFNLLANGTCQRLSSTVPGCSVPSYNDPVSAACFATRSGSDA